MNNLMLRNSYAPLTTIDDFFGKSDPFVRVFDDFFRTSPINSILQSSSKSKFTVEDNEENVIYKMAIPGIDKENLDIDIKNDILTVSYKKKDKNKSIISYNSFSESIYLQENVDIEQINAEYIDGVLQIKFAKLISVPNHKKIIIQ